ncbi:FAD binding domain-containing protein [Halalkalicoccus ordinarius]|uniref:FAD binding domain-containing protein n=1 Tax=Halalkalicoccus ordinarius TaxID=3116651 RepID=UPI00300EC05E
MSVAPERPGMTDDLRVIVSGGSMGGLFAALALREAGCAVDVFERASGELESRGAGIVAQPRMMKYLKERGVADPDELTLTADRREYLERDGSLRRERADSMAFTAWDALYRRLRGAVADERYHAGRRVVGFERDGEGVTVRLEDGERRADLLVVAEGGRSSTREKLLPDVAPEHAGYVAWRGLVDESDVPADLLERFEGTFPFYEGEDGLMLGYLIPGPDGKTHEGARRLNWVWYDDVDGGRLGELLTDVRGVEHEFSVPPGALQDEVERGLRTAADERLPELFSESVRATDDPFVQTIYDLSVPRMAFDRVCLLGDAAFVARPHTAAGTEKAAADAIGLGDALAEGGDLADALADWETDRLKAGRELVAQGARMGDGYMN